MWIDRQLFITGSLGWNPKKREGLCFPTGSSMKMAGRFSKQDLESTIKSEVRLKTWPEAADLQMYRTWFDPLRSETTVDPSIGLSHEK